MFVFLFFSLFVCLIYLMCSVRCGTRLNHEVCAVQLMKDLVDVTPEEMLTIVIAYEPVWAIGTGTYPQTNTSELTSKSVGDKLTD